jgi:diguanylate cyclase (GGDEF)-like protein
MNDELKNKIIVVAMEGEQMNQQIQLFLGERDYKHIQVIRDGTQLYALLRQNSQQLDQIGLVIIDQNLPGCQVKELCQTFSCSENGFLVPFLVITLPHSLFNLDTADAFSEQNCLIKTLEQPVSKSELLLLTEFLIRIKQERFLRYKQEERLISELAERKVVDSKLKYLIVHDELTGLYNRNNFERQLRLILNRATKLPQNGALLFVDIDRFSMINELEGFDVGDRVLVELVIVMRKLVDNTNLFARIGSDEFCLFLENHDADQAIKFASQLKTAISESRFFTGESCYNITVSIGITTLNSSNKIYHPSELIIRARQACNTAKKNGRNLIWLYNENDIIEKERRKDIYWVPVIKKALLEKEFFLTFQPVIKIATAEISHYEVLIRMQGDGHVVTPNQFIPAAERMGLISSIDLWVVETSIDFLASLPSDQSDVSLTINLSSMAFQDKSLLPTIRDKLELTWVDASRLTFEITETAAIANFEQTREMINNIRALGCKFALDDFGAGFCSFNYLKSFPVDFIKIDGQFIQNLPNDETDQVLVRSMVEIASQLGKKTIAEFVETPAVISKLKEIGVDYAQGYLFGKPETTLLKDSDQFIQNILNVEQVPLTVGAHKTQLGQ